LISGFGLIVGSAAIAGALGVILAEAAPNLEKSLLLRPFPQEPPSGMSINEFRRRYRDGMIDQAGICVFICGLKETAGKRGATLVAADGVIEEFESAKRLKRVLIPIGATGGAAKKIWSQVKKELDKLCPHIGRKDFDLLNDATQEPKALAEVVGKVIAAADKARPIARKRHSGSKTS
jgi:hypothetical protein